MGVQKADIHVANIETELKKLWEQDREEKKIRASLFNLILYSEKRERRADFEAMIHNIIEKFPCRVIFIESAPAAADHLNIAVLSETTHKGETTIACDEINLTASGASLRRVPFIVSRHLIPDLPVYLFWGHDPTDSSSILPQLQSLASRLILVCDCTASLPAYSHKILEEIDYGNSVMDINWALTSSWRDLLAQVCSSPETLDCLQGCCSLNIGYNGDNIMVAAYLQGWLAAQLDWKVKKCNTKGRLTYLNSNGNKVIVTLAPKKCPRLNNGMVASIQVESEEGVSLILEYRPTIGKVLVKMTTQERCDLPISLPLLDLKRGYNLIKEIFYQEVGAHYVNTLHTLAAIPWNR